MIKKFFFLTFITFISPYSFACKLPAKTKLKIGCSYNCDFSYRFRLKLAALVKGYPIEFVNLKDYSSIEEGLSSVDAVLIPGGADIDPEYYLPYVTPELAEYTRENLDLVLYSSEGEDRDQFEFDLVKAYSNENEYQSLPLLGVCRGMQMMSVAQGIPLYLDIRAETGIKNRYNKFDRIEVQDDSSLMRELFGYKKFRGYKLHHQGIRMNYYRLHQSEYPLVKVTSTSHNGMIGESLEYIHRPALGVQYHPEKSLPRSSFPIYDWYLTRACEHSKSKDKK